MTEINRCYFDALPDEIILHIYEYVVTSWPMLRKVNLRWRNILADKTPDIPYCMHMAAVMNMKVNLGAISPETIEQYYLMKYYDLLSRARYTWELTVPPQFLRHLYTYSECDDTARCRRTNSRAVHMAKTHCFSDMGHDNKIDALVKDGVIANDDISNDDIVNDDTIADVRHYVCRRIENTVIEIISRCKRDNDKELAQIILLMNSVYMVERAYNIGVSFEGCLLGVLWSSRLTIKLHDLGYGWPSSILSHIIIYSANIDGLTGAELMYLFEYVINNGYTITDDDFIIAMKNELSWAIRKMHDAGYVIREEILADRDLPPRIVQFVRTFIQ